MYGPLNVKHHYRRVPAGVETYTALFRILQRITKGKSVKLLASCGLQACVTEMTVCVPTPTGTTMLFCADSTRLDLTMRPSKLTGQNVITAL